MTAIFRTVSLRGLDGLADTDLSLSRAYSVLSLSSDLSKDKIDAITAKEKVCYDKIADMLLTALVLMNV